jgi:hypothetical protein
MLIAIDIHINFPYLVCRCLLCGILSVIAYRLVGLYQIFDILRSFYLQDKISRQYIPLDVGIRWECNAMTQPKLSQLKIIYSKCIYTIFYYLSPNQFPWLYSKPNEMFPTARALLFTLHKNSPIIKSVVLIPEDRHGIHNVCDMGCTSAPNG